MFRIIRLLLASVLAVAVFQLAVQSANAASLPPLFPAPPVPPPPVIESSSATATQLTINGSGFTPGTASVLLGDFGPLAVTTQTASKLVVTLPSGLTPGNYVLSVQIGATTANADESVATIGGVGATGPAGPTGATGATGPARRRWRNRCNRCDWAGWSDRTARPCRRNRRDRCNGSGGSGWWRARIRSRQRRRDDQPRQRERHSFEDRLQGRTALASPVGQFMWPS